MSNIIHVDFSRRSQREQILYEEIKAILASIPHKKAGVKESLSDEDVTIMYNELMARVQKKLRSGYRVTK